MQTLEQLRDQDRRVAAEPGPVGLGGWLILPMLGMFASPLVAAIMLRDLWPLLAEESALTAFQTFVVWFEAIANLLLRVGMPIWLLTLFFRKKRQFPSLFAAWITINLVVVLVDLLFAYNAFRAYYDSPGVEFWDRETIRNVSQSVFGAAIWVPYMFNSARVRNTFVN